MKSIFRRFFDLYFTSWWLPTLVFLIFLGGMTGAAASMSRPLLVTANYLLLFVQLSLLGIVAAFFWKLVKKQWLKALVNFLLLISSGTLAFFALFFLVFASMFGPSEDGFADNLTIPANIEVADPTTENHGPGKGDVDTFQSALLTALKNPGNSDSSITANVASLEQLQKSNPEILRRYLVTSPAWRVFREDGNIIATRRWMTDSTWRFSLHGYYSAFPGGPESGKENFQSRTTIGLSGKPWWEGNNQTTRLKAGQTAPVIVSEGNQMSESHCLISADPLVLEIFEQSGAVERRLTKTTLKYLNEEFAPLVAKPTREEIWNILPPGSIKTGTASLELANSFQPGIYNATLWVNPGEPGMIYLKAFEVTKGTRLSDDRLEEASNEWIGWSNDPKELFFSDTHFTIYEGDWEKPYAARFEVWFRPDSKGPERKLLEKVYKIEGWQR